MQDCEKLDLIIGTLDTLMKDVAWLMEQHRADALGLTPPMDSFNDAPPWDAEVQEHVYSVVSTLPEDWKYKTITIEMANAVASSRSVQEAADKLEMKKGYLELLLKNSKIRHLYGEKWSLSMQRALNGSEVVDDFKYPEDWKKRGMDFVKRLREGTSIKSIADAEKVPTKVLARFLDNNGFNSKGDKICQ